TFTAIATVLCLGITRLVFPPIAAAPLFRAVALWLAYAALLVVVMTFFSAALSSFGASAGAGLVFLFVGLVAASWNPVARYTFLGLPAAGGKALASQPTDSFWPLLTALAVAIAAAFLSVRVFERKEL